MARISATVSVWHLFATKAGKKQDQRLRLKPQKVVKFSRFCLENVHCRTNWVSSRGSSSMLTFPDWFSVYLTKHQVQAENRFMTSFLQCYKCDSAVDGLDACNDSPSNMGELVTCPPQEAKGCFIGEGLQWITKNFKDSVIQLLCLGVW